MLRKILRSRTERIAVIASITALLLIILTIFFLVETQRWFDSSLTRLILVKSDNSLIYFEDGNQIFQGMLQIHPAARFNVLSMQKYRCTTQFYSGKHDYYDDQDIYLCFFKRNYGGYTEKYLLDYAYRPPYPALGEEASSLLPDMNFLDVSEFAGIYDPENPDAPLFVFFGEEYNLFFDKDADFVLPGDPDYKFEDDVQNGVVPPVVFKFIDYKSSVEMRTWYIEGEILEWDNPRYLYNYKKNAAIAYMSENTAVKLYDRLFEVDKEKGMIYDYIVIELTYKNIFELNYVKGWAKRWGYDIKKVIDW